MSNTARQTGTAIGVAVFGAVAGSTRPPTQYVNAVHGLALLALALWLVAAALAATTLEGRARAKAPDARPWQQVSVS
jgi:DHA2 family methylenomycin A resistance protein-like MFS transporter